MVISYLLLREISQLTVKKLICASFTKAGQCCGNLMHFGFVFFLRKRDSIQFPNSEAVTRKKKHHLPWEVHNRKANNQSFPEQIQSKANKFMENTLAATGGFENTEYLKNCIASSCRHRSCLSLSPAESPSKALSLLGTHPNIISRINL